MIDEVWSSISRLPLISLAAVMCIKEGADGMVSSTSGAKTSTLICDRSSGALFLQSHRDGKWGSYGSKSCKDQYDHQQGHA
jgi:hypothetical protein